MAFGITLIQQQNQIVLKLKGSLDQTTLDNLLVHREKLSSTPLVSFDLSRLRYIDSTGVGILLSFIHELRSQNIDYVVEGSRGVVRDTLVTLGFPALIGEEYFLPPKKKRKPAVKTKEEKYDDEGTQSSGLCTGSRASLLEAESVHRKG